MTCHSLLTCVDWSLVTAVVAVIVSIAALIQSHRYKVLEARPWFAVQAMRHEVGTDNYRLIAVVKHVSGGIALDVRFSISISDSASSPTTDAPAILPGDTLEIRSHLITGPQLTNADRIKWTFSFEDQFRNKYGIEQVMNLANKQLAYSLRRP